MLRALWSLCCSLKMAIYMASACTLLLMGGSLLIPGQPLIFSGMDSQSLGHWFSTIAVEHLPQTWWLYLAGLVMVLFVLNTFCCFLDWLWQIRSRWRKSGEYLLHLGVVLVVFAYFWGSAAGWRQSGLHCRIGQPTPLPDWPGHSLRVENFQPIMSGFGPPEDMISQVSLLKNGHKLDQGEVRINQPLLRGGLVITPLSFTQEPAGFQMALPGRPMVDFRAGSRIALKNGSSLEILRFFPDAKQAADGSLRYRQDRIGNPVFELSVSAADGRNWRGWYFIKQPLPQALLAQGIQLRPLRPLYDQVSILTVNYDPGVPLAAVGGGLMTIGVLLALTSFYRKRRNQDRPEI